MVDYYRYKECMDEARKLTAEADALMEKGGAKRTEGQQKCASLLQKATLLRKLAMEYAFGGPRKPLEDGHTVEATQHERAMATTENGARRGH
jgi:hypothetical protein